MVIFSAGDPFPDSELGPALYRTLNRFRYTPVLVPAEIIFLLKICIAIPVSFQHKTYSKTTLFSLPALLKTVAFLFYFLNLVHGF
jgi:hypothetical protein